VSKEYPSGSSDSDKAFADPDSDSVDSTDPRNSSNAESEIAQAVTDSIAGFGRGSSNSDRTPADPDSESGSSVEAEAAGPRSSSRGRAHSSLACGFSNHGTLQQSQKEITQAEGEEPYVCDQPILKYIQSL
jgi:hypothetical protein